MHGKCGSESTPREIAKSCSLGKNLPDSSAVLSSQAVTALWVTLTLRDVSRVLTKSRIPPEVYTNTHMVTAVTSLKMTGKYKVGVLFWKERV